MERSKNSRVGCATPRRMPVTDITARLVALEERVALLEGQLLALLDKVLPEVDDATS